MTFEHIMVWIIPALALLVSAASFSISLLAYRRSAAAEKPIVWIELTHTAKPEWYTATLNVTNRSPSTIEVTKLAAADLREFSLANYFDALTIGAAPYGGGLAPDFVVKEKCYLMPLRMSVAPGQTASTNFLLFKALFSRATNTTVTVMMETKEAKPKAVSAKSIARF